MAFQIKNFRSIVASMINHMRSTQTEITDFNVGSIARTVVEAPAIEIDELYQQMFNGLKEAIPVATYNSFNFTRLPAVPASGLLTVTIGQSATDVLISAGTNFSITGGAVSYVSQADVTIVASGTTAQVLVSAAVAGAAGNVPANQSFIAAPAPGGFVSATNAAAFSNGADEETDDQRAQRFAAFVATLQRGTVAAIAFGAETTALSDANGVVTERVVTAAVIEPYVDDPAQPVGLVKCYVHNGAGGTSGALVAQAQKIVDGYIDTDGTKVPGWKAAGVVCNVLAATEVPVNLVAALTAAPGYDEAVLSPLVKAAWANYVQALAIGQTYIHAEAIKLAMEIPGVANFVPSAPTADVAAANSEKLMPGTRTLT